MFGKILKNRIILSIILVTILLMVSISVYLPKVTEQNTIDIIVKNSSNSVEQIKLTRAYYVEQIVGDIKKYAPNIKFDYEHDGVDGKIAFPTTVVHELSDIFSKNTGLEYKFYSKFPFAPKKDRTLTPKQEEILDYIEKNDDGMLIQRDFIEGKEVLRVAIADVMTQQACVDCHNNHKDRTWESGKWKLGDKRGVLEVITPLDESLEANNIMKNKILTFIFVAMVILMIFYSITLIRREKELLNENDILDEKVKKELAKNIQKEKKLIQQSRSAAMGEMMAAIIHQWKQPLNGISMATSSIKLQSELGMLDKEFLDSKLDDTKKQIELMSITMNDFKNFFKPQEAQLYNINTCLKDTFKMIRGIYEKSNIEINIDHKEELYTNGFPNEMKQVVINILNNARDAIVEKNSPIRKIDIRTQKDDNNVLIIIKDYAGGIPDNIIDKVFDPYFTTKSDDKGTGIGLDMSKVIVDKVNGDIKVKNVSSIIDNTTYIGAQFTIILESSNQ